MTHRPQRPRVSQTDKFGLMITTETVVSVILEQIELNGLEEAKRKFDVMTLCFAGVEGWAETVREVNDVFVTGKPYGMGHIKQKPWGARMPECLATAKAMVYWQRLKDAGFVDENCMLLATTSRQQTWVIAEMFAEKLKLKNTKWKLFQDFWNIKNLAQDKKHSQEYGMPIPRLNDIAAIFDQDL